MRSVLISGASAPPITVLQASAVRRRIAASDSVAALLGELAFGHARRGDLAYLAALTADRIAASAVAR